MISSGLWVVGFGVGWDLWGAVCRGEEKAFFAKRIQLSALFATWVSRICDLAARWDSRTLASSKRSRWEAGDVPVGDGGVWYSLRGLSVAEVLLEPGIDREPEGSSLRMKSCFEVAQCFKPFRRVFAAKGLNASADDI